MRAAQYPTATSNASNRDGSRENQDLPALRCERTHLRVSVFSEGIGALSTRSTACCRAWVELYLQPFIPGGSTDPYYVAPALLVVTMFLQGGYSLRRFAAASTATAHSWVLHCPLTP